MSTEQPAQPEAAVGAAWFQQELARLHARIDALEMLAREQHDVVRLCLDTLDEVEPQVRGALPASSVHFAQQQARALLAPPQAKGKATL